MICPKLRYCISLSHKYSNRSTLKSSIIRAKNFYWNDRGLFEYPKNVKIGNMILFFLGIALAYDVRPLRGETCIKGRL